MGTNGAMRRAVREQAEGAAAPGAMRRAARAARAWCVGVGRGGGGEGFERVGGQQGQTMQPWGP